MAVYTIRAGKIRKLKEGVDLNEYLSKYPEAYKVCKPPTEVTLQKWDNDGYCKAVDGCHVEPDGTCEHGKPSWMLILGYI